MGVYHSKPKGVRKSKSHDDKLLRQMRRYSSDEVSSKTFECGISGSGSFQENLSRICENAEDAEEEDVECPIAAASGDATDENKNRTVREVLTSSSSVESDDGPAYCKASIPNEDATSVEPGSPKKKSSFEKTKNKIHKGFKRLSISDSLFSNSHGGRRLSLPVFPSLPDFKAKNSNGKNTAPDKSDRSSDEEKGGPTYVNMVEEKPELFAPLDSEYKLYIIIISVIFSSCL